MLFAVRRSMRLNNLDSAHLFSLSDSLNCLSCDCCNFYTSVCVCGLFLISNSSLVARLTNNNLPIDCQSIGSRSYPVTQVPISLSAPKVHGAHGISHTHTLLLYYNLRMLFTHLCIVTFVTHAFVHTRLHLLKRMENYASHSRTQ